MRFEEGRAWIVGCPVCLIPVIEAHVDGMKLRLSTKAIPVSDAKAISKYRGIVINIWKTHLQFVATAWFWDLKTVDKGHLFIQHVHGAWM
jgi:hypothetical protein